MKENKQKTGLKARADGYRAEDRAVLFLRLKGNPILERNSKPPRGSGAGEIDIIAYKNKTLVFIEVKYRISQDIAAEAVSVPVRTRRIKGAEYFISTHPEYADSDMRFDAVLMAPNTLPKHIQNAWETI